MENFRMIKTKLKNIFVLIIFLSFANSQTALGQSAQQSNEERPKYYKNKCILKYVSEGQYALQEDAAILLRNKNNYGKAEKRRTATRKINSEGNAVCHSETGSKNKGIGRF